MFVSLASNYAAADDLEHLILLPECQHYRYVLSGAGMETGIPCIAYTLPLAPSTHVNIYSSDQGKEALQKDQ